jgi:hypothetical protein
MNFARLRLARLWLVAAMITGCATPKTFESAQRFDMAGRSCVASIDQVEPHAIPFVGVGEKEPRNDPFQFNELATCINAADGAPVPVVLFEVGRAPPLQISIQAISDRNILFSPRVDLLDSDFRVLRSIPFSKFERRGFSFSTTFFLNAEDAEVRLIALVPDATAFGKEDRSTVGRVRTNTVGVPVAGGMIFWNVTTGDEDLTRTWLSEVGPFRIVARPYQLHER